MGLPCRSAHNGICPQVCLHSVLRIHDTSGIHYTFGLPGLLGGITYVVLMAFEMSWASSAGYVIGFSPFTHPCPGRKQYAQHSELANTHPGPCTLWASGVTGLFRNSSHTLP